MTDQEAKGKSMTEAGFNRPFPKLALGELIENVVFS
jgi:hypothetical protein